ncbi:Calx-beta domain-containing protein [Neptuniibacter sp.]|uniref:Calx-beta domain-containing protein n=1 Tax=Neptuniibacter sp. TaxID=1962643 RepID=UPI0026260407|nr:Calx-beta domain-containing protein [Neptuniibacter sp.]MCP4597186.1 DUF4214 domain-containing protein [Neptuniibacter sp.]
MAASDYFDQVQKIYIAYYGRAADPGGQQAWAEALDAVGGDLSAIIEAFGTSPEAEARFGGLSSAETITALYQQLFNRDPESQLILDIWVDQLENNPAVTLQSIALDLLNGAQNNDAQVIQNRLDAANSFTDTLTTLSLEDLYRGNDVAAEVRNWLSSIGHEAEELLSGLGDLARLITTLGDDPTLSVDDVSISEAEDTATVTFTREGSIYSESSFKVTTQNGTASAYADFESVDTTVTFKTGETTAALDITIYRDNDIEETEAFTVTLSEPDNLTIPDDTATVSILDDDVVISVEDIVPTSEGDGSITVTFKRTGDLSQTNSFLYQTEDDSALAGSDYTAISGEVTFEAGETEKTIQIQLIDDFDPEDTESFNLIANLFVNNSDLIFITTPISIIPITILDNDPLLAMTDISVNEDAGTALVTVTRSGATQVVTTVDYATSSDTATSGEDFTLTSGTLTFAADETEQQIEIPIINDDENEGDESFQLNLTNVTNGVINDAGATVTIADDEHSIDITDVSVNEGDGSVTLTITRTGTANSTTVEYSTADNDAEAGSDYVATDGTLTFEQGETEKTLDIDIIDDNTQEENETFFFNLANAITAHIEENQVEVTIRDDEAVISVVDATVDESAGTVSITVTREGSTGIVSTVEYFTEDVTASSGDDYTEASGTLTFAEGETEQTVVIDIIDDTLPEDAESFLFKLDNATNSTLGDAEATVTIDANGAYLTISNRTANESSGTANITVTRSGELGAQSTVDYATTEGTAQRGIDYYDTSGTLTFEEGDIYKYISVELRDDSSNESNERFYVELSNAINAEILDAESIITLIGREPTTDGGDDAGDGSCGGGI